MQVVYEQAQTWLREYIDSFYHTEDQEVIQGIKLKDVHTQFVKENCRNLAMYLGLAPQEVLLCELIGLLHDVGRFRQWTVYKTFRDNLSEDHADLGVKVIKELPFFGELSEEEQSLVLFAIGNHNKKEIAKPPTEKHLLLAKIIRDADKLDIYRINIGKVCRPEIDGYTEACLHNFMKGEQISFKNMHTKDDLKLVYLLWAYDVYYNWTLKQIVEKLYLNRICEVLPKEEQTLLGIERLKNYISKRLSSS